MILRRGGSVKRIAPIIAIVLLLAICSSAQQATPDAPASREEVDRLLVAMHSKERMQLLMDESRKQSKSFLTEYLLKQVPAAIHKREQVQAMVDEFLDKIYKDYPVDGILNETVPIYQKHLTESDVNTLINFYSTPVGQKVLHELPAILLEVSQINQSHLQPKLQEAATELTRKLTEMIDNESEAKP